MRRHATQTGHEGGLTATSPETVLLPSDEIPALAAGLLQLLHQRVTNWGQQKWGFGESGRLLRESRHVVPVAGGHITLDANLEYASDGLTPVEGGMWVTY